MESLRNQSVKIILEHQAPSGAYYACPNFPTYRYAWFRDGSFCAYALGLFEQNGSADRFYRWSIATIGRYQNKLNHCIQQAAAGVSPTLETAIHARFTVEGEEIPGRWGNHQLDGLGTWLWAISEHIRRAPAHSYISEWLPILRSVRDYLMALWRYPCSDCWEENEDEVHTYTLGAVYAGLNAFGETFADAAACQAAAQVQDFIRQRAVLDGRLVKSLTNSAIDASLVALAVPYRVFDAHDPVMQKTLELVVQQLSSPGGGVRRYQKDTYYGGGEWVILSAWLGWILSETGQAERAREIKKWIEKQASPAGELPEQLPYHLNAPDFYPPWVKRWGPIASPLLWSQAMYLILSHALQKDTSQGGRAE